MFKTKEKKKSHLKNKNNHLLWEGFEKEFKKAGTLFVRRIAYTLTNVPIQFFYIYQTIQPFGSFVWRGLELIQRVRMGNREERKNSQVFCGRSHLAIGRELSSVASVGFGHISLIQGDPLRRRYYICLPVYITSPPRRPILKSPRPSAPEVRIFSY